MDLEAAKSPSESGAAEGGEEIAVKAWPPASVAVDNPNGWFSGVYYNENLGLPYCVASNTCMIRDRTLSLAC